MEKIKKFEDIESWKLARKLTGEIYTITSTGGFVRDLGLRDQIRRASVSILSNLAFLFSSVLRPVILLIATQYGPTLVLYTLAE